MLSVVRLIRFFWFLTIFVYFIVVFLCYFQWPDPVAVHFNDLSEPIQFIGKSPLFYAVSVFLLAYNILFVLLNSALEQIPVAKLPIPNKDFWIETKSNSEYFKSILKNCTNLLGALLNIIFNLWIITITYANLEQYDMRKPLENFKFITPLFFGSLIVLIVYILTRPLIKKIYFSDNNVK